MQICIIEGCPTPARSLGYCPRHYRRLRLYGDPQAPSRRGLEGGSSSQQGCVFPECGWVGRVTKGYCPTHYMRLLRHGNVETVLPSGNVGKGRIKHELYRSWSAMINRCLNPNNSSYASYGERGITVCDRWREDFQNFLADVGERPPGTSLDRINPDGNYEPGNCRWASPKVQRNNLSVQGEAGGRAAISRSKIEWWRAWRIARGLPADAPSRAEYRTRSKARG